MAKGVGQGKGGGGRKPGAGRPQGAATKKNQELQVRALESGITPMEVLLEDMRYFHSLATKELMLIRDRESEFPDEFKRLVGYKQIAAERAKDVAPYIHSKLSQIDAKVAVTNHEAALAELE